MVLYDHSWRKHAVYLMERFSRTKTAPGRTPQMAAIQNWVEGYICGVNKNQSAVDVREDDLGLKVTQLMFDNKNRWAHVCPFVRDSIDRDMFWIEESEVDGHDKLELERLLTEQIIKFKNCAPAYDPLLTMKAAPLPILWKTFLTFFPRVRMRSKGPFAMFDDLHGRFKLEYIRAGLMLGQFYPGCQVPAVYNPFWKGPLVSPYPAFAVRYMAKHDKLFIKQGTPGHVEYAKYFSEASLRA